MEASAKKNQNSVLAAISKFSKDYVAVVGIVLLSLVLWVSTDNFMTWDNWKNILLQSSTVAICALGQAIILLTGNFDLSLGRNVAFTSCLGALLMKGMISQLDNINRMLDRVAVYLA